MREWTGCCIAAAWGAELGNSTGVDRSQKKTEFTDVRQERSLCSRRLAPVAGLLACVGSLTRGGMPAFLMAGLFGFA